MYRMKKSLISKVVGIIVIVLVVLGVIGFCFLNKSAYEILVESNNTCDGKEYSFNYDGKDVYTDCISDISVRKNGKLYKLKDAIEKNVINFNELLDKADKKLEYWDGGSVLYQYKDFTIIDYQRLYDKDCDFIVIGNKNITIDDYCK